MIIVDCNLHNTDNPFEQIKKAVIVANEIIAQTSPFIFNMRKLTWIEPLAAAIISHALRQRKIFADILFPYAVAPGKYLANIGFPFGGKSTQGTSAPIYHFDKQSLEKMTSHLHDFIDIQFPDTLKGSTTKYIVSELIDNISQHSSFGAGVVLAQYFPTKSFVDIVVLDDGVSIPGSFQNNSIVYENDADAILKAISGVSTKDDKERGTGLNSTESIVTTGLNGELCIFSRNGVLTTGHSSERKLYILQNISYSGTIIHARFQVPEKSISIYDHLE